MKKLILLLSCLLILSGCETRDKVATTTGYSDEKNKSSEEVKETEIDIEFPTAEKLLQALKIQNSNLLEIQVFNEETDLNGKLGRPGYYISKANFSDSRVEQNGNDELLAGTIEVFESEKDCKKRFDYLSKIKEDGVGNIALNQYIYQYDKAIFRISYDLTPNQAEEYHQQMNEIITQYVKDGILKSNETDKALSDSTVSAAMDDFKNAIIKDTKEFDVTDENSNSFFEILIKASEEISKLKSSEIADSQLFNAFALSAGYLCNNFESNTDYGKAGELAFELINCIITENEEEKANIVSEIKALGSEYSMEIQTLPENEQETEASKETEMQVELSTGKYVVGEDIPAGKYDIVGIEQGNVHVCSPGTDYGDIVNEIIKPGEITYANVQLVDGCTVEVVLGGKIQLQPK